MFLFHFIETRLLEPAVRMLRYLIILKLVLTMEPGLEAKFVEDSGKAAGVSPDQQWQEPYVGSYQVIIIIIIIIIVIIVIIIRWRTLVSSRSVVHSSVKSLVSESAPLTGAAPVTATTWPRASSTTSSARTSSGPSAPPCAQTSTTSQASGMKFY